ncbi:MULTISPECIES: hypothetical protein [Paenibacillus]|uniref:hypothetical protein n=1 Tax=Paenibacillus TaxID=44249 RepID=UPI000BBD97DD|nr:hypothetical protein [Paenibacillus lautus]PCL89657.1 hypothetical protein CPZ30_28055 [Paenibacillus lautus]GIP06082.1 hypothetical protein J28TS4_44890 [Paenibacillus lautus]
MDSVLYLGLAAIYAVLFLYGCVLMRRDASPGLRYLLLIVTAGLVWDNGVIGIGKYMGEGDLLEGLNVARFWVHALATPLLVLVSFDLIRKAGSPWTSRPAAAWGAWLFTAALIVLEVVTETLPLKLQPSMEYGALRYVSSESGGPPLMVILILIPLLTAGIIVWRRKKTPLLFIGTVLMAAGSAIPIPIESSAATNVFELLLLLSLWLTVRKLASSRTLSFR